MGNRGSGAGTIIAFFALVFVVCFMLTVLIPTGHGPRKKVVCLNNLRNIGGMLVSSPTLEKSPEFSGARFLLQIAPRLKDDCLYVFICPQQPPIEGRPEPGTPEFVRMYRENFELTAVDEETLRKMCSYSGPDWPAWPPASVPGEVRIWAADACHDGELHHEGLCVLMSDGSARYFEMEEMGDPRLRALCFYPRQ